LISKVPYPKYPLIVGRATLALKNQRDHLHKYQKKIRYITDLETEAAKEALRRGDKGRALLALRRKKYQESLLAKTDTQLFELEKLVGSIDFAIIQKDVYYGLQQGTAVLKAINDEMKVEDVERLMDNTTDAIAYQQEISDLLGSQISNADAEEVERELEEMEAKVSSLNLIGNF